MKKKLFLLLSSLALLCFSCFNSASYVPKPIMEFQVLSDTHISTDIPKNSVVIMPGVAFDKTGNRIGYGKGYYDKYFSKYPDLCKIAIAFSLQIVSEIQADKFDVKADCVITESVIYE